MHELYVNLVVGIIGGIYSSIIVSRIFLIREEYQDQLEILQKNFYYLGSIRAFLDVIEMILKNMSDTSCQIHHSSCRKIRIMRKHIGLKMAIEQLLN